MVKELILVSLITSMVQSRPNQILSLTENLGENYIQGNLSSFGPDDIEGAIVHPVIGLPDEYIGNHENLSDTGTNLGYEPNTLMMNGYEFYFSDYSGNTGMGEDFNDINDALNRLELVKVGQRGIETFFGHNNNLSNTGPFAILGTHDILYDGIEVVVTDSQGLSKGYLMTQTVEFSHQDQIHQFYGDNFIPELVYNGNHTEMVYIQHCRWDVSFELLVINLGYRIW